MEPGTATEVLGKCVSVGRGSVGQNEGLASEYEGLCGVHVGTLRIYDGLVAVDEATTALRGIIMDSTSITELLFK